MPARIELPVAEIARRYIAGEGVRELGRAYGVCHDTIARRLRTAGVKIRPRGAALGHKHRRKRGGPLNVDGHGYLRTRDREDKLCYIHRGCWEAHRGPILDGHDIHHVDGDIGDNCIENLACMTHGEHMRLHGGL